MENAEIGNTNKTYSYDLVQVLRKKSYGKGFRKGFDKGYDEALSDISKATESIRKKSIMDSRNAKEIHISPKQDQNSVKKLSIYDDSVETMTVDHI